MSWALLFGAVFVLGIALLATVSRRAELGRMKQTVRARERAVESGAADAQLQHPVIDLSRCLGCATCVAVCPEDGVLDIVHGQAMVVNGARCVGISACERECPAGAVTVTLSNLEERNDIPALSEDLEALGSPGLFLAGEVTAHALIKTAVEHGKAVATEVARRTANESGDGSSPVLDLCIVGAGPAGLAGSLEAKRLGLRFVTLEQEGGPGGTVAKYPRRKLVMTQPVDLPLHGRMRKTRYSKEELMELWQQVIAEHQIPIIGGEVFTGLHRDTAGHYEVRTESNAYAARNVCLALGRRGSPNRLGVPGEELPKVTYSLLDARSYQGRRILVVGGGDSAVETAVALAEQPDNEITLSYRKDSLFRIRSGNEQRLQECVDEGKIRILFRSEVTAIRPGSVELAVRLPRRELEAAVANTDGRTIETPPADGADDLEKLTIPNDEVFVAIGGSPPIGLLQRAGVSFEPGLRESPQGVTEQGTGLIKALTIGLVLTVITLGWALWHVDYYALPAAERPAHAKHLLLRPGLNVGLWFGVASAAMIVLNLLYLLRRSPRVRFELGSLRLWMTSHVATGIIALLCAIVHGAMTPRDTPGGYAFWALFVLLITGAIGRYFYAYVPRAANGRELELAEVKSRLGRMAGEWDQGQQRFRERVRSEVLALIESRQWRSTFLGRVLALFGIRHRLGRVLHQLAEQGREEGITEDQIDDTLALARRAHGTALMAAHYEDLRAVLNTWRYLHRWVAALMVLLVIVHIVYALAYGSFLFDRGGA